MDRIDDEAKRCGASCESTEDLEREILALWRSADEVGRGRIRRLLSGVLSGRITLTLEDISSLRAGDVFGLADTLPDEQPQEWIKCAGLN